MERIIQRLQLLWQKHDSCNGLKRAAIYDSICKLYEQYPDLSKVKVRRFKFRY